MSEERKSEFGKGLVICLVKFAEHAEREIEKELKSSASMWFNGASDHLYEIEVPEIPQWDGVRAKVKKLRDFALGIGHRDRMLDPKVTVKDIRKAIDMTEEIAMDIDKVIGLEPEIGEW